LASRHQTTFPNCSHCGPSLPRTTAGPAIRPKRYSPCLSATLEHALSRGGGTASLGRSSLAGTAGRAHLYRLAVHPAARRRGIAQALLDAGAERLSSLGATRLDAMVLEGNELGQALWQASGYSPQAEWRRWIKPAAGRAAP